MWIVSGTFPGKQDYAGNADCQVIFDVTPCGQFLTNMKIANWRLSLDVSK